MTLIVQEVKANNISTLSLEVYLGLELYRRKKILVRKNSGSSVSFMIRPNNQGLIDIKVTANSPKSQDVATKQLRVFVSTTYLLRYK